MKMLFVIHFLLGGLATNLHRDVAAAGGVSASSDQHMHASDRQQPNALSTLQLQEAFSQRREAWLAKVGPFESSLFWNPHSWVRRQIELPEFERLVELGPRAVPLFVEAIEGNDKRDRLLNKAVERIIRRKFGDQEDAVKWWKARPTTFVEFDKAHQAWRQAKSKGNLVLHARERVFNDATKEIETGERQTELGQAYEGMRAFGIDVLPLIVEKIKAGDHDLIPLFQVLTGGVGIVVARASDDPQGPLTVDLRLWEHYKDKFLLPPVSAAKLKDGKP